MFAPFPFRRSLIPLRPPYPEPITPRSPLGIEEEQMDIPLCSHSTAGEPEGNTTWSTYVDELGLEETQGISNPTSVTYSYNLEGKPFGYADTSSFGGRSQNAYFSSAQGSTTLWLENVNSDHAYCPLPGSDHYYVAGLTPYQIPEAVPVMDLHCQPNSTVPSSASEVHDPLIMIPGSEELYRMSLTSFHLPSTSDDDPLDGPEFSMVQHTSLLPDQHSKYSELSANLAYMDTLSVPNDETTSKSKRPISVERRKKEKVPTKAKQHKRTLDDSARALISTGDWSHKKSMKETGGAPLTTLNECKGTRVRNSAPLSVRSRLGATGRVPAPKHIPPPSGVGRSTFSPDRSSTGKKLGLACLFCRERKIACGRPSESSPDQTCNQCARRLFKCEYPTESRRGQHKRPKNKPDIT